MRLTNNSVHVWVCDPRKLQAAEALHQLSASLSPHERLRYRKFHFAGDRHAFLVAHGLLRHLVSLYIGGEARRHEFLTMEHGRPELVQEDSEDALRFNISHTCSSIAWAFSRGKPCGVDVEQVRYDSPITPLTEASCSPEERHRLSLLHGAAKTLEFYRIWCLKEAVLKGCGLGLIDHLDSITTHEVGAGHFRAEDRMRRIPDQESWFLQAQPHGDSHMLAIAYRQDVGWKPTIQIMHVDERCIPRSGADLRCPAYLGANAPVPRLNRPVVALPCLAWPDPLVP
ncbi:MAG TPA: 4'-phosphopantetheinyl transferase superfamily protein [Bryobacteraceae bacterium]|nr:4'-phosphopantetheinyl transferase superfamily protein [Bryobacteraceae bacterium]